MPNIIQIEELVYTRLPRISKSEWLKMLSKQGVSNDYALLLDDYLLIEQTDYRFSDGNYISSERTVYNIDYTTYDTAENTPNPDNTEEIITVRYDSTHDRYYVYYTHFPIEDIPHTPDLSHILSEADIPSSHPFVQAPVEEQLVSFLPPKQQQPEQKKTQPSVSSTPSIPATEYRKPWRQKRLAQLKELYHAGYTLRQIVNEFDCTPEGAIYQLKTYLGIDHPFEQKNDAPKPQPQPQPKLQEHTPKNGTEYYKKLFCNMCRSKNEYGEYAPHKVILMLAVLQILKYPSFPFKKDFRLQVAFMDNWQKYVKSSHWTPNLNMPWEHMPSEPFWQGEPNSREASVDPQLQKLIMNKDTRKELKASLISLL